MVKASDRLRRAEAAGGELGLDFGRRLVDRERSRVAHKVELAWHSALLVPTLRARGNADIRGVRALSVTGVSLRRPEPPTQSLTA